ncbi:MAG: ferritin-like domain-containing protein [Gammaproteobacteria bacterium]|nr:ferritin-like domain-containing protein [Gammaproteobacteria bacterium]MDH3551980.1 ferritin-like domain-containing protein [Gammaproteobacteria bacterium]
MQSHGRTWSEWRQFFESRRKRPLPVPDGASASKDLPRSFAESLAIFQLGESGGGTIIEQARASQLPGIDADYAEAMALFVREENRHADILALCVRELGGELTEQNWTARLFVFSRRLIGLRLKVLVLLAAEVVGICYYHILASRLPEIAMKDWLTELVADEQSHLDFHCRFLNSQTDRRWKCWVFVFVWRITMFLAAVAVLIDHRGAIRDLQISKKAIWQRWTTYSRRAERLVVGTRSSVLAVG